MSDAPHTTPEGVTRLFDWARRGGWKLLPATKVLADRLGVGSEGIEFRGPDRSA